METTRYLTIHFPMTDTVTVRLDETQFEALRRAMESHAGDVIIKIEAEYKLSTRLSTRGANAQST